MKDIVTLLAALLLAPLAVLHAADAPKPASKPNILILLADDMGYGDPGCYNPKSKIAPPHIGRLAREGMRFTDAHAPGPLCHPSRYGLLTPPLHGGEGVAADVTLLRSVSSVTSAGLRA